MASAVILWILRILLLLIVVLLIVPAGVRVVTDRNGTSVRLKILFWTFAIPAGEKKEKKKEKQPDKKEEKKPEKGIKEKVRDFGVSLDNISELLRQLGKLIGALCRTIRVDVLDLVLPAVGGTPEETGRNTGLMWAAYGNVAGLVANIVRLKVKQVTVIPDFSGKENDAFRAEADITASPGAVIIAAAAFLLRLLRFRKKYGKRNGGNHE